MSWRNISAGSLTPRFFSTASSVDSAANAGKLDTLDAGTMRGIARQRPVGIVFQRRDLIAALAAERLSGLPIDAVDVAGFGEACAILTSVLQLGAARGNFGPLFRPPGRIGHPVDAQREVSSTKLATDTGVRLTKRPTTSTRSNMSGPIS